MRVYIYVQYTHMDTKPPNKDTTSTTAGELLSSLDIRNDVQGNSVLTLSTVIKKRTTHGCNNLKMVCWWSML